MNDLHAFSLQLEMDREGSIAPLAIILSAELWKSDQYKFLRRKLRSPRPVPQLTTSEGGFLTMNVNEGLGLTSAEMGRYVIIYVAIDLCVGVWILLMFVLNEAMMLFDV